MRLFYMGDRFAQAVSDGYEHDQISAGRTKANMYWPDSSHQQPLLDARVQRHLGERLRKMYSDVGAQEMSSRLNELLKKLDQQEHKGQS
ncbi:MAG: NepR family anti-sigma factor [Xanthobacteraceae bacterium]